MQKLLERIAEGASGWVELRYQARSTKRIAVRNGALEESASVYLAGIGVRVLVNGVFGFASTTQLSGRGIRSAIETAQGAAQTAGRTKKSRIKGLADCPLATGTFPVHTDDPLDGHPLEEKLNLALRIDDRVRTGARRIVSSAVTFSEIQDEKVIVTNDGASARVFDSKPDFRVLAIAEQNGDRTMGLETAGVTGGWSDLFAARTPEEIADHAVRLAVEQLVAPHPSGASAVVVLNSDLVGLLSHEAIGHTVEADIVLGGAVTADKIGKRVASELVMLCDSGVSEHAPHAVGTLPVDDEGVLAQRAVVIEHGILRTYLHNRETAAHFGVPPTGNARAFTYSDNPIIRMRNTYVEPGETPLDELFGGVQEGYYLRGLGMSGQADSNGEFMFGVREARRIVDGHVGALVRGATISGNAFAVLRSVDAVGNDFSWDNASGYCGKGQPAKVAAGGPHLRCTLTIGGRQE